MQASTEEHSSFASPGFPVNQVTTLIRVRHRHLTLGNKVLLASKYSVDFSILRGPDAIVAVTKDLTTNRKYGCQLSPRGDAFPRSVHLESSDLMSGHVDAY